MKLKHIKVSFIFVTLITVTTLVSCRKDYTCNCTVKEISVSGNTTINDKLTVNLKSVSKNTAKTNCVSYDGIDLEGLEYLDADEARVELTGGILKLKAKNFLPVNRKAWENANNDPKNWAPAVNL